MPKEMDFFIFLIEQYAANKNTTADQVLQQWDEAKVTDTIYNMYERYHTEAIENAFEDIDRILEEVSRKNTGEVMDKDLCRGYFPGNQ